MWFVKARRAQNQDDDETWKQGGVCTTLNAFDNGGESRATVLIIDGTRVDDVRVTDDEIMQTVIQRWGTGGGNVPAIAYALDSLSSNSMKSSNPNSGSREITLSKTIDTNALNPAANQGGVAIVDQPLQVRRLTPMECERLQGFPDNWTATQSDSQRYRQMGNAVTVNVIESIGQQLGRVSNG
jgi:DNA (cytosine-5)-methyltransferase 1